MYSFIIHLIYQKTSIMVLLQVTKRGNVELEKHWIKSQGNGALTPALTLVVVILGK